MYLVLISLSILAILGLCALTLGLGMLSSSKEHVQNIANLVATAALEEFVRTPEDPQDTCSPAGVETYQTRACRALRRANFILHQNRLPGAQGEFANLVNGGERDEHDAAGVMELGNWLTKADPFGNTCQDGDSPYPCFKDNGPPASLSYDMPANAVRIRLRNSPANPLLLPLGGIFGTRETYVEASAIATLRQQCTAYLIDVSLSTFFDTHRSRIDNWVVRPTPPAGESVYQITEPLNATLPAFRYEKIPGNSSTAVIPDDPALQDCGNKLWVDNPEYLYERHWWCNMEKQRPDPATNPPFDKTKHYRTDYRRYKTNVGNHMEVFFDAYQDGQYVGPQPFTSYFQGMNAGLRLVESLKPPDSKAVLLAFTGKQVARFPNFNMSTDLGMMTQVTNVDNRGRVDYQGRWIPGKEPISPNFLDYGIVPLATGDNYAGATNLISALDRALYDLNKWCPNPEARRSIVLATDGVGVCTRERDWHAEDDPYTYNETVDYNCPDPHDQQRYLDKYQLANWELASLRWPYSIVRRLIDNGIALTVLFAGDYVKPHFLNIKPNGFDHFLDFDEARGLGYVGYVWGAQSSYYNAHPKFIDSSNPTPTSPDNFSDSMSNLGKPGYYLGIPGGILTEMALSTGGYMCPLMDLYVDSNGRSDCDPGGPYAGSDCKLRDNLRIPNAMQTRSIYKLSRGEQAAECVKRSLLANPYMLVTRSDSQ